MRASKTTISLAPQSSFRNASGKPMLIAGPGSAETELQTLTTAQQLQKMQFVNMYVAGIWNSRICPDGFEGVGAAGLPWLQKVKAETGFKFIVDVSNVQQAEEALNHGADVLSLNGLVTVNPYAVQEIAEVFRGTTTPLLVSNPVYPDLGLWVGALARLNRAGLTDLGAIHRGFSGQDSSQLYRNQPKWDVMLQLRQELPNLPILVDVSHIAGKRSLLYPVGQRALDLGADGLLLESHINPAEALGSPQQQLMPQELEVLVNALKTRAKLTETNTFIEQLDALHQEVENLDQQLLELLLHRTSVTSQMSSFGLGSPAPTEQLSRKQEQLASLLEQYISTSTKQNLTVAVA